MTPLQVLASMREQLGRLGVPAPMRKSRDAYSVLISTVISLRTRDRVTEEVSSRLLERASTPRELVELDPEELQELLRPAGFFRQKARQLRGIAESVIRNHGGEVPDTMEELLELPGVGRKTANFIMGMVFGKPSICVDVHVHRISNRMGLVKTKSPEETEYALQKLLPESEWTDLNHTMVRFGQRVCRPVKPLCEECTFSGSCPSSRKDKP